jgi:outer membrane lipoprotein LolB
LNDWLKSAGAALLMVTLIITGCAIPRSANTLKDVEVSVWRGRLAVRIEPEQALSQALSAGFELLGDARTGKLTLFTPLGSTAAALSWTPQTAIMQTSNGDVRYFDSLDALISQTLGTEIPVAALFAWLAGDLTTVAGWQADLSQYADGRITARRSAPTPLTELRLVLEK